MTNSNRSRIESDINDVSSQTNIVAKRRVGRPQQSILFDGREKILDDLRRFMRERPFYNFQRKEIAEYAGVTPALVSYYFPERQDLVIEAASPIILDYSDRVSHALHSNTSTIDRAEKLISEFLKLGFYSGYTIDYFLMAVKIRNRRKYIALLEEQYTSINKFMEELALVGNRPTINASFLQSSIWGQCMYLSRQPHLQNPESEGELESLITELTMSVVDLLSNGLSI